MDVHSDSTLLQELIGNRDETAPFDVKEQVFIRHPQKQLWRSFPGGWITDRNGAVRFETNIDALTFCRAAAVHGVLVGVSGKGAELYEISVVSIVDTFGHQSHAC